MINYYEIQSNNIISQYGGIGSIIDTPEGSVMISNLDAWPYYHHKINGKDRDYLLNVSVNDIRLIDRLRYIFPNLQYLLKIPLNATENKGNRVKDKENLISAEVFPHWMHCPRCNRFMHERDWAESHKLRNRKGQFSRYCPFCDFDENTRKRRSVRLEQVRFIRVSKDGSISDFPWEKWFKSRINSPEQCQKHELTYKKATNPDSVDSIWISCSQCKQSTSLTGIFNYNYDDSKDRTVLKSSNSVYFPAIIRSLMIPRKLTNNHCTGLNESDYRDAELSFMLAAVNDDIDPDECLIHLKSMPRISDTVSLISIRSLTMVAVLCSYSRLSPINPGYIWVDGSSRHVTNAKFNTSFLPASELLGEGFLICFKDTILRNHYEKVKDMSNFRQRLYAHYKSLESYNPFGFEEVDEYCLFKYVALHSLAHILIKQLESVCGYPASSINERIYSTGKHHSGIMIYTVAGSEGSYGGIVTLTERGDIPKLLEDALDKAQYCTNDPVCYKDKSVCFSCMYLPETSCEAFNSLLDRTFLVDKQYGVSSLLSLKTD